MTKLPPDPQSAERQKRIDVLATELETQTDRGVAILAAAWLDDAIKTTLHSCLNYHKESWERLFEVGGALDSLSSRIDLLTLLGVISPGARSELHRIREIRNDFAHLVAHKDNHESLTLASPHISDKIRSLVCLGKAKDENPRHLFIRACLWYVAEFDMVWFFKEKVGDVGYIHLPTEGPRVAA